MPQTTSTEITDHPQFEGADDFDFLLDVCLAALPDGEERQGWEGAHWGYAPTIATDENGKKLKKKYKTFAEAKEEADKHSTVLAITQTRALSEGTPVGPSWYSLRGSRVIKTAEASEAKEEITWIKEETPPAYTFD
jgi:hypothetical protein